MKKELYEIPGTIAYALHQHKDELYKLMEVETSSSFAKLRQKVDEILDSGEVRSQEDVRKAKEAFNNSKYWRHYLSTLTTYMLGIKV